MTDGKPPGPGSRPDFAASGHLLSDREAAEDLLPDHLPRWLEAVSRRLGAELGAHAWAQFPELRGSQRRILQMIPPAGIRITDLAALAGMTKQALGEFVDSLERSGFAASRKDERDGRVRIVMRTQSGDAAAEAAQEAIELLEQRWRDEIGAAGYAAMMDALRQLGRDGLRA